MRAVSSTSEEEDVWYILFIAINVLFFFFRVRPAAAAKISSCHRRGRNRV